MKEKPALIITPSWMWTDSSLPITVNNVLDMAEYDSVKVNGEFSQLIHDPLHSLNMVITTDVSQLRVENLKYYSDVVVRKDDEFFSLRTFVDDDSVYKSIEERFVNHNDTALADKSVYTVNAINTCIIHAIKNDTVEYTECDWYIASVGKRHIICDIFPNIKEELKHLYEFSKAQSLLQENVYTNVALITDNSVTIDIVEHEEVDYGIEDSTPNLNLRVTLKVNPNSKHIKYVSVTKLIQDVFEYMDMLY